MTDFQTEDSQSHTEDTSQPTEHNPWETIAKDFQVLGQSIADAVKTTINDENTKKQFAEFRTGLQTVADQVTKAVDEAIKSPTAQEAKTEAKKAASDVVDIGDKVYTDARPHLVNALKKLGEGIQTLVERLETTPAPKSPYPPEEK